MRILAFDAECFDNFDICEFGYVIADLRFGEILRNVIYINPERGFKRRTNNLDGANDLEDDPESRYRDAPTFPEVYDRIRRLLTENGYIVIGFGAHSDISFLDKACERYGLAPLDFTYIDAQLLYKECMGDRRVKSLEDVIDETRALFNVRYHHSSDDAFASLVVVKRICRERQIQIDELVKYVPAAYGDSAAVRKKSRRNFPKTSLTIGELTAFIYGVSLSEWLGG